MAKEIIRGIALFQFGYTHISGHCHMYILAPDGTEMFYSGGDGGVPNFLAPFSKASWKRTLDSQGGLLACAINRMDWYATVGAITDEDIADSENGGVFGGVWHNRHPYENSASEKLREEAAEMRQMARGLLCNLE